MKVNEIIDLNEGTPNETIKTLKARMAPLEDKEKTIGSKLHQMKKYPEGAYKTKKDLADESPEVSKLLKDLEAVTRTLTPLRKKLRSLTESTDKGMIEDSLHAAEAQLKQFTPAQCKGSHGGEAKNVVDLKEKIKKLRKELADCCK